MLRPVPFSSTRLPLTAAFSTPKRSCGGSAPEADHVHAGQVVPGAGGRGVCGADLPRCVTVGRDGERGMQGGAVPRRPASGVGPVQVAQQVGVRGHLYADRIAQGVLAGWDREGCGAVEGDRTRRSSRRVRVCRCGGFLCGDGCGVDFERRCAETVGDADAGRVTGDAVWITLRTDWPTVRWWSRMRWPPTCRPSRVGRWREPVRLCSLETAEGPLSVLPGECGARGGSWPCAWAPSLRWGQPWVERGMRGEARERVWP